MGGTAVTTGASAVSGLLLAAEAFGGVYLLVTAILGRGRLYDDEFVKAENLHAYRKRARIWFAAMGITLLCAGAFNLLVSMMGVLSLKPGLTASTLALVAELIVGYLLVRKFVNKNNAPMT